MMSASSYLSASNATDTLFTDFDTQDYSTGSISHVSGTFTIPSTGTYLINFEMTFDAAGSTSGIYNKIYIIKNGSGAKYGQQKSQVTGGIMFLSSSCQMRLIANDTIELYVYQNTGASLHIGTLADGAGRLEITKLF